ncbi:MAG TPA: hypothetical protein VEM57_03990, partial [Candidatus Binatus sp.]|nr:hypothetical protein [Candidatus Binatus sp.]
MRRVLVLLVAAALAALLLTRAEPFTPTVTLETPVAFVGRATPIKLVARDRGTGLAHVEVRLVGASGAAAVLASESYAAFGGWLGSGSGIHEVTLTPTLDAAAARIPEGHATLEIWATDHSWLAPFHRGPRLTHPVTVDLTPPTLEIVSKEHVARLGGSECAVYRVGADTVRSGVEVGREFFPSVGGYFVDPALRATLFAVPQDGADSRPAATAADAAGNARTVGLGVAVRGR